jgi:hypothetical protein
LIKSSKNVINGNISMVLIKIIFRAIIAGILNIF